MIGQLFLEFDETRRCSRCDTILKASTYRDNPIILAIEKTKSKKPEIFCVRCSLKENNCGKSKVTLNELDSFLDLDPEGIEINENPVKRKYFTSNCRNSYHDSCNGSGVKARCCCQCHNREVIS